MTHRQQAGGTLNWAPKSTRNNPVRKEAEIDLISLRKLVSFFYCEIKFDAAACIGHLHTYTFERLDQGPVDLVVDLIKILV